MRKLILIVMMMAIASMFSNCVRIEPGELGVRTNYIWGGVQEKPLAEGYGFYLPWLMDITKYNVQKRTIQILEPNPVEEPRKEATGLKREHILFQSKDGQNVWATISVTYYLDPDKLPHLHRILGREYFSRRLVPETINTSRIVLGTFNAAELYQGLMREEAQQTMAKRLNQSLSLDGIVIVNVLLDDITFTDEYQNVIEQKEIVAQEIELNKNRTAAAKEYAKKLEAEAQGRAAAVIAEAEGRRKAMEEEAKGNLALAKADADGKRFLAEAMGGGENVVKFELAKNLSDKIQIWGVPTGGGGGDVGLLGLYGLLGPANQARIQPVEAQGKVKSKAGKKEQVTKNDYLKAQEKQKPDHKPDAKEEKAPPIQELQKEPEPSEGAY